jgi:GNAT superfamily N-acetyltransferase
VIRVRVADVDGGIDLAALVALRRAWGEETAGGPVADEGFADRFVAWVRDESSSRTFFLAEDRGEPVGMANVKHYRRMPTLGRDAGEWGYVGNVFVLPERRNDGIGSILMKGIEAWAKEHELGHLRLAPRDEARVFYERLGYAAGAVVELDP